MKNLRTLVVTAEERKTFNPEIMVKRMLEAGFEFDHIGCPVKIKKPWDCVTDAHNGAICYRQWDESSLPKSYDKTHGSAWDRGSADAWYHRPRDPHKYPMGTYNGDRVTLTDPDEIAAYHAGYDETYEQEGPNGGKQYD